MSIMSEEDSIAGYQNWRHLVFLHWRVAPDELQVHLPPGLTVEPFDGAAWLALVPFAMERVRPWWSPAVPGISWFLETNVRTYVRHESGLNGVWFFSLDANCRLAVRIARTFWSLNYIDCQMSQEFDHQAGTLKYTGQRSRVPADVYNVTCQIPAASPQPANQGSLEHFLLERYRLLSQTSEGNFVTANVIHEPYTFLPLTQVQCQETYTTRLIDDRDNPRPPVHAVYSPGVDVRVTAIQSVK